MDDYNMFYWTHIIYSINNQLYLSMGKSRQNKTVKTIKSSEGDSWENIDINFEVAKKQKYIVADGKLVTFGDDMKKAVLKVSVVF